MITINYVHRCGCTFEGHAIQVRPEIRGSYYVMPDVRCIETQQQLVLVSVEQT